ncbi:hypothetical protein GCM10010218_36490 [Streptomyces mashuensis]|uniref:Uncharacterized protein n=1 Tax=Streptomyces mashuensis TaxID=33904 RepID=A0A919ECQ6_9ACTN|nr:hypothetical protein [Streptomyces mashuensis]GHF51580.1 hypothetical protein GCM10010218_36490 [Streptomyces mashuensis]
MTLDSISLPLAGGQWMATSAPPEPPPCRGCVALSAELKTVRASNDTLAGMVVRARLLRHFANWHGYENRERK